MDSSNFFTRNLQRGAWMTLMAFASSSAMAAPGPLANVPLFATDSVKPNIIMVIDDSGSMDSEVLFSSNDGALWWNTKSKTFVGVDDENGNARPGKVNFNSSGGASGTWKKYTYLFPNGTGDGNRVYDDSNNDHFAIPPLPQYAFARSPHYNGAYYNPNIVYEPWRDPDQSYADIDPTKAPSDPKSGNFTFDLTTEIENTNNNHTFRMYEGMIIPKDTVFKDWKNEKNWGFKDVDRKIDGDMKDVPIKYDPAVYYLKEKTGNYTVVNSGGMYISGDCSNVNPDHYSYFHAKPGSFSSSDDIVALAPDGECLKEYKVTAEEMQNFANWFSYYRKRHMALRGGIGRAFETTSQVRVGMFTINHLPNSVTMMDLDNERSSFFNKLYNIDGHSGGTQNRRALNRAGEQFSKEGVITEACQKNFIIHFTDGFSTTEGPDVGNCDGDDGKPFADEYSNTLADIAMKYYEENPRENDFPKGKLSIPRNCPDPTLDCNSDLHVNTITVGLGAQGTIFGKTHFSVKDAHDPDKPTIVWPNVNTERDPRQVDDLYHAAVNGRGEMYNAKTTDELSKVMQNALKDVKTATGAGSAASFSSTQISDGTKIYVGLFNTADWSGNLLALPMSKKGDIGAKAWAATDKLDDEDYDISKRNIFTHNGSQGVAFEWEKLSEAQKNDLRTNPDGNSGDEAMGKARLDYLRGDRSQEASADNSTYEFRNRGSRLGDIVHSQSIYVDGMIYVGANDGMLHGFDAETGEEVLAYIPGNLFSDKPAEGLHYLTDPDYRHRYYVDLSPMVAKNTSEGTVLVGGERGGGRGIFALDVSNPRSFDANDVLWEFTHNDDADLGYTFSDISIAKMNNDKWAAIFGNGYCDEADGCDGSGKAALFIVYLDGSGYEKITTEAGSKDDRNGLSTPSVVDINGDGVADWAYAGDLKGNLWAFNLTSKVESDWALAYGDDALFKTKMNQPITSEPIVVKHPLVYDEPSNFADFNDPDKNNIGSENSNYPNTLVLFGTGQYLVKKDKGSMDQQAFYAVWDDGTPADLPLRREDLQQRSFVVNTSAAHRILDKTNEDNGVDYQGKDEKQYGWYIDLPASKERVISRAIVRNNVVFFDTVIPSDVPCEYGGSGWLMAVNLTNGDRTSDVAFDYNRDDKLDAHDKFIIDPDDPDEDPESVPPSGRYHEGGMPISEALDNQLITNDTNQGNGDVPQQTWIKAADEGRLSWQELQ